MADQPIQHADTVRQDWLAQWEEWRAKRWLDRRAKLIEDIPSWRLIQELQQRGVLVHAGDEDLGLSKTVSRKPPKARPVDRDGFTLWRLVHNDGRDDA